MIVLNWALEMANTEPTDATDTDNTNTESTDENREIDFAVGGQAVIEGVMMRSPNSITIAVRKPDGSIKIKKDPYQTLTQKIKALNIAIVRGVVNLFEMMVVGTKAINFSANESIEEEDDPKAQRDENGDIKKSTSMKIIEGIMFAVSLIVALGFSLFLFKFLPLGITTFLDGKFAIIHDHYILFNIIDGGIKAFIFLSYIFLLSLIPSFRRVFEYHGAEHKSIFTYEKKLPLTPENATKQTRFHPRCGTSFIIIVFIISILFYTLLPKQEAFLNNFLLRATFLPLVAGISYEFLKISAKHSDKAFIKMLIAPGLAFQKLTTKEPDHKQLEVGLKSLEAALIMEKDLQKST